ncbi:MAG: cell division protein FtsA [Candidatus Doudnabacteria bacterium RIFCSPHIGHO2_01_FULL_50_67]|uniref:Cell division protein FtsA n=1 Tax=Candidatus Doudnabacteria bacterium RIFCSPHIGHO2_12_FULL_48_16 TaxID=1817838 RepID=A0A1F5PK02_9BACT|nr:MAG: cell division protein FtsA [Candidatus Doudnabacteria bacterium RIFCSPHIGHO2_02_FULL_49_24]OGE89935.1 MAG: cell division protein FtsA [Candidatus Doudnabacteria bacterium RIFCSPHIGHO2_01_FULL_50_67]OGE90197.1 MAG: cell division protein FtsA [Candidatus Doudnabacteria bacterium RIFCSPHIGHO2_12_FULL_48_16]OGE97738.1 MAG: cell division protein FtsA [Candidatus Doudnabacteria bacterium RIFCSPLOWO2_01_FULL_49_40]OGF02881.1 MAG: cell division protein FtsA [Candidatus Doudnabacteria bacterium 
MAKEKIFIGLDVGSSTIRVVVGKQESELGSPSIVGVGEASSAGIRRGVIVDIDEAVSSISEALEKAERMTGLTLDHAVVSVGGAQITSQESHGVVAVARADGEITEADVVRVVDASQAISIPANREILHVIPKNFTVDGQTGIKDPVGMSGIRLEVDSQIIQASVPFIKNLTKCILQAGLEIDDLVLAPLASAQAVLNKKQKELGVVLIDLGGGTTGLVVFEEGDLAASTILPVGSMHITNDLAIGLRTSVDTAEKVKLQYGHAEAREVKKDVEIDLAKIDKQEEGRVSIKHIAEIIEARLEEIFDLVNRELKRINRDGQLPAGAILTGGGAKLPGVVELAKKHLRLPVSLGLPGTVTAVLDRVNEPQFATAVGLVMWANEYLLGSSRTVNKFARKFLEHESVNKMRKWFKSFLP